MLRILCRSHKIQFITANTPDICMSCEMPTSQEGETIYQASISDKKDVLCLWSGHMCHDCFRRMSVIFIPCVICGKNSIAIHPEDTAQIPEDIRLFISHRCSVHVGHNPSSEEYDDDICC